MGRVSFPATGTDSGWLPVLVSFSNGNRCEAHIDIGTHVACVMSGEGSELGVILGAFYDDNNSAPDGDMNIWRTRFADGTEIFYDRQSHTLTADCTGDVEIISGGNTDIQAGGNVSITAGNFSITYKSGDSSLGISSPGKINIFSADSMDMKTMKDFTLRVAGDIDMKGRHVTIEEGLI